MQTLVALIILVMAQGLGAVEIPKAIRGTWVVTGYHFGGSSALSDKVARSWIGKRLVIGPTCLSLTGKRIAPQRIQSTEYNTRTYFREEFGIEPSRIGYRSPKVREYLILKTGRAPWLEPGGAILSIDNTRALTVWDGAFFTLQRTASTKPPAANGRQTAQSKSQPPPRTKKT